VEFERYQVHASVMLDTNVPCRMILQPNEHDTANVLSMQRLLKYAEFRVITNYRPQIALESFLSFWIFLSKISERKAESRLAFSERKAESRFAFDFWKNFGFLFTIL
jgi:hypothetical protein